jgi:hypothetical protein
MVFRVVSVTAFMLSAIICIAQDTKDNGTPQKSSFVSDLGCGASLGLQFGNTTFINFSPQVGYRITDRLIPGIGAGYRYMRVHYPNQYLFSTHIWSASVWTRVYVLENIFAYIEYENLHSNWDLNRPERRFTIDALLAGAGYRQALGSFSTSILVLFNTIPSYYQPYRNPTLRVMIGYKL